MRHRHKLDSAGGFSLLEVVVASFILLVVVVMSLSFWVTCAKFMAKSRARAMGTYVAEQAMEKAMAVGYSGVDAMEGKGAYAMDATLSGRPYSYTVQYETTVEEVDENLKSVVITVKWDEVGGEASYETFLCSTL